MTDETKAKGPAAGDGAEAQEKDAERKGSAKDIKRGYMVGTYQAPDGKGGRNPVPIFHVVDQDGRPTGHASLDPNDAAETAAKVRAHLARRRALSAKRQAAAAAAAKE